MNAASRQPGFRQATPFRGQPIGASDGRLAAARPNTMRPPLGRRLQARERILDATHFGCNTSWMQRIFDAALLERTGRSVRRRARAIRRSPLPRRSVIWSVVPHDGTVGA